MFAASGWAPPSFKKLNTDLDIAAGRGLEEAVIQSTQILLPGSERQEGECIHWRIGNKGRHARPPLEPTSLRSLAKSGKVGSNARLRHVV